MPSCHRCRRPLTSLEHAAGPGAGHQGDACRECYDSLLARAADVCLKERRKLVLVVRETPLHLGHLRLMAEVTEYGAIVLPPMPAFYHQPKTIADLVDQTVGKVLDQFGIDHDLYLRWGGGGSGE